MTNFSTKMIELFSCVAQFKISMAKRKEIIAFVNLSNQVEQNCRFSKIKRRFIRLKRRIIFPIRRFGFLCFRAESPESTRLWQSIGDAPKFGGLREGFFLVVWKFFAGSCETKSKEAVSLRRQ